MSVVESPPGLIGPAPKVSRSSAGSIFLFSPASLGLICRLSAEFPHNCLTPPICRLSAEIAYPLNLQPIRRNSLESSTLQSADYRPKLCAIIRLPICRLSAELPHNCPPLQSADCPPEPPPLRDARISAETDCGAASPQSDSGRILVSLKEATDLNPLP